MNQKVSVILPCFGRYEIVEPWLNETIKSIIVIKDKIELIVVLEGSHWENSPLIKTLKMRFPHIQIISIEEESHLPSYLYNEGLKKVNTKYVTFLWPGCLITKDNFIQYTNILNANSQLEKVYYLKKEQLGQLPYYPSDTLRYGWCQCERIYELNNLLIDKEVFKEIGNFEETKILQKYFDWEFIVRLARNYDFFEAGIQNNINTFSFNDYPFNRSFNISKDIAHRYILRCTNKNLPIYEDEINFVKDLPLQDQDYLQRTFKNTYIGNIENNERNYKITIIGGLWDYIHNQLCFFNYFDKLYGKNFATYKVVLDYNVTIDDVKGSDLVILSRCRNPKILDVIQYCNERKIATMYMIDDNWLSVAKDWPEHYGNMFIPGKTDYDVFITALKQCKASLVYNKYLEEDIKEYSKQVYKISVNINLDFYKVDNKIFHDDIIIGYSGSLRYDDEAFKALAEVALEHKNVKLLVFGWLTPQQEKLFNGINLLKVEYKSYIDYCRKVSQLRPTILLAPLDYSRTSMSKCPNKYLDITASGAVGIYSNIYPYAEVIKDGFNGFLVENNEKDSWKQKINFLLENNNLVDIVRKNSINDIKNNFATEVVMEQFCNVIDLVIRGGNK